MTVNCVQTLEHYAMGYAQLRRDLFKNSVIPRL